MKIIFLTFAMFFPLFSYCEEGDDILKKSDDALIPAICTYDLSITTSNAMGDVVKDVMTGYKKGGLKNVLVTIEPKRVKGSAHLRKDKIIWSYFTTNQRLLKMSYKAVFMNTLLNYGDVFSTELTADYEVISVNKDPDNPDNYILNLRVRKGREGYDKILFRVDSKTYFPVKKEYYAVSGTLLKSCDFTKIEFDNNHALKLVEMIFYEPVKDRTSTVIIDNIKIVRDIPEMKFNEHYLKFIGGE